MGSRWAPILRRETQRFCRRARGHRMRSRVDFACQEIVLPEGPHEGERWRPDFQPYAYHVLYLMDTLGFRKYRGTGCVQSGKTFTLDVIPTLWHLFERKENVIFGLPEMDMAETKWVEEFSPVFDSNPWLARLLPRSGRGSKGGFGTLIKFRNGTTLKFMGGSGKDSRRSGATAPVVIKTEVDRYDVAAEGSREAPPVEQMEARTEAFDDLSFSYEECTVTTEDGRIWTELQRGTATELYSQCRSCGAWQLPDRESLHGIDDAPDVLAAAAAGRFVCKSCGVIWEERDRQEMIRLDRLVPVHRGQTIRADGDGRPIVEGPLPATDTFSIRWNEFLNRFHKTSTVAREEWGALYARHPEEKDLKRRQFAWAMPAIPKEFTPIPLTLADVYNRGGDSNLGVVPPETKWLTRGVDIRATELHYIARAWQQLGPDQWCSSIVDIGLIPVRSKELGVREALLEAMTTLRDQKNLYRDADGQPHVVNLSLVDASWMEDVVFGFMLDLRERHVPGWLGVMGRGQSEPPGRGSYVEPQNVDPVRGPVLWKGEQCHIRNSNRFAIPFVMANSDHWKFFVRTGYSTPRGLNGAIANFNAITKDEKKLLHEYGKQTIVERMIQKRVARRGVVEVFVNEADSPNHYGDCDYYSCVAANVLGVKIATRERQPAPTAPVAESVPATTMPDGRNYMDI
jgi:hypothetical protein